MHKLAYLLPLSLLLSSTAVWCEQDSRPELSLGLSAAYEDNPKRVEEPEDSDIRASAEADLFWQRSREFYNLDLNYEAIHDKYLDDTFGAQTTTYGRGSLLLGAQSSSIKWLVENVEQQVIVDSQAALTPENASQRSIFSTGPLVQAQLGKRDQLSAQYLFTSTDVEGSNSDSESRSLGVNWRHRSSKKLSTGINLQKIVIKPQYGTVDEIEQQRVSLVWQRAINRGSIVLQLGQAQVDSATLNRSNANEFKLILQKFVGSHELLFEAQKIVSDSGRGLQAEQSELGLDLGSQDFDLQERSLLNASWGSQLFSARTGLNLFTSYATAESLQGNSQDTVLSIGADIDHQISPLARLELELEQSDYDSETSNDPTRNRSVSTLLLRYTKDLNRNLSVNCGYERINSRGETEFEAQIVQCGFSYDVL